MPGRSQNSSEPSRTVIYTDGACRNNANARLRRAGCGVFYGAGDPRNFSCPVPGRSQTNQRAELLAIVLAVSREADKIDLKTDSQYCYDGAVRWQQKRQTPAISQSNSDLWGMLYALLRSRPPDAVHFYKVKGHATDADVRGGRVDLHEKHGNDGADTLACLGADAHQVARESVAAATFQREAAVRAQRMMVEIVKARRAAAVVAAGSDDAEETDGIAVLDAAATVDMQESDVSHHSIPGDAHLG